MAPSATKSPVRREGRRAAAERHNAVSGVLKQLFKGGTGGGGQLLKVFECNKVKKSLSL